MKTTILTILLASSPVLAQAPTPEPAPAPAPAPETAPPPPAVAATVEAPPPAVEKRDRGAFVLGVKGGGLFPEAFSPLGPSFLVDVEIGWILPFLKRGIAITIDGAYTQPTAQGGPITDPRITSNNNMYSWDITQREVIIGLTLSYRMTFIGEGKLVPYIGVGPRLFLLQTQACPSGGQCAAGSGNPIAESDEQSTKVGVGVPLGIDYLVGPGRIFLEAQLLWAPIDHRTTGDSSVGSITAALGYRLTL